MYFKQYRSTILPAILINSRILHETLSIFTVPNQTHLSTFTACLPSSLLLAVSAKHLNEQLSILKKQTELQKFTYQRVHPSTAIKITHKLLRLSQRPKDPLKQPVPGGTFSTYTPWPYKSYGPAFEHPNKTKERKRTRYHGPPFLREIASESRGYERTSRVNIAQLTENVSLASTFGPVG